MLNLLLNSLVSQPPMLQYFHPDAAAEAAEQMLAAGGRHTAGH